MVLLKCVLTKSYFFFFLSGLMADVTGKTELAKQVARYLHKDMKKVRDSCCVMFSHSHTHSCSQ